MGTTVARFEWNGEDKLALLQRNFELGGAVQTVSSIPAGEW